MNKIYLPKILALVVSSFFLLNPIQANASSAYVSPTSGLITVQSFKVSFYVESTAGEPEIAGAHLKITYPANIKVVSINNAEFDSYIEKVDNPTTRTISINAVNNAGNYKSGKVKLASVDFEAVESTGQVQLSIDSTSEINGAGGEQLLTETINGVYSLNLPTTTVESTPAVGSPSTETSTVVATTAVPETGGNNVMVYLLISSILIALGIGMLSKRSIVSTTPTLR